MLTMSLAILLMDRTGKIGILMTDRIGVTEDILTTQALSVGVQWMMLQLLEPELLKLEPEQIPLLPLEVWLFRFLRLRVSEHIE